jgi:transcriptional regulator with PAS, ATPase and Fis domain
VSGVESIPKIIHSLSHRKHGKYIAVNCGAIPEGTIDSELFGHEKALLQERQEPVKVILK